MGEKVALVTLPVASTALLSEPVFEFPGGEAVMRFDFEREGERLRGGLRFGRVRAFRFRAEGHCTAWHVEDVYDTLAEVAGSGWVSELLTAEPGETWGRWVIRHFMIYIDSAGCYEVAAESWSWLAEERLS
ncbi:MAG: hypothetical protein ACT4P1_12065 [Sporichthyaceae bacterium]